MPGRDRAMITVMSTLSAPPDHRALFRAVITLGVVSQVAQIVVLRDLLMVCHGNELSIGLILAAWMIWVGVGSRLGAILGERCPWTHVPLSLTTVGTVITLPLSLYAVRALRGWISVLPGAHPPIDTMALACLIILAPIGLLLGAHFVLLARAWGRPEDGLSTAGGNRTYMAEATGNAVGGAIFSLILVHVLDAFQIAALAGTLLLITSTWLLGSGQRRWLLQILLGSAVIGLLVMDLEDRSWRQHWQRFAPEHRLVSTHQSKHGTIAEPVVGSWSRRAQRRCCSRSPVL